MTSASRKLYRSKDGMLLGICQGIADWRDMPVKMVRIIFVIIACVTAIAPCLIIYLVAAFFIPVEPSYREAYGRERRHSHRHNRSGNKGSFMDDIKEDFEDLKDRVNKMEDEAVNDKESDWDRRFHEK